MSVKGGPNFVTDKLVFCVDPFNDKGTPNIGCGAYNSDKKIYDLIGRALNTSFGNVLLSNRTFYTAFGISYPESSYGGDAASRNGLTQGFNVRSGSKTFDSSRSLHMWVWNNDTGGWVADSYFHGLRLSGHCYDNYAGAETGWQNEINYFNSDYAQIKSTFPNATFIITGSHACQCFDSTAVANLISLGAPSATVSSWTDNSAWREFVLVGKPGLGDSQYYGWAYENYTTNPTLVGHLNFGLPVTANGNFTFTGSESLAFGALTGDFTNFTVSVWFKSTSVANYRNVIDCQWSNYGATGNVGPRLEQSTGGATVWIISGDAANNGNYNGYSVGTLSANTWYNAVITRVPGSVYTYLNGTAVVSNSSNSQGFVNSMNNVNLGRGFHLGGSERYFTGEISAVYIYNEALSGAQVRQNFNAQKSRYGL